jgi:putative membrane protein
MKSLTYSFTHLPRASLATAVVLLATASFGLAQTTSSSSSPSNSSTNSNRYGSSSSSTTPDNSANSNYNSTANSTSSSDNTYGTSNTTSTDSSRRRRSDMSTTSASEKLSWMDRRFVTKTADGNKDEIALAKLAAEKATNPDVRNFAQKLVDDHTAMGTELTDLAGQKNVKLDNDNDKDRAYKRLSKKSGDEFDREFVEHMIDEHENDIKMFEKESTNAKDSELREFASKNLAHLREHLAMAQNLRSSTVPTGRTDKNSGHGTKSSTGSYDESSTSSSSSSMPSTSGASSSSTSTDTSGNTDSSSSTTDQKRGGSK